MKKLTIFMLAAACFASCQKSDEQVVTTAGRITIEPLITRATEVNFEDGDRIGLTISKPDRSLHAENAPMTFDDGIFSGNLSWYSEAGDKASLVAYYPYDSDGVPATFTVVSDQSAAGYGASDFMAAAKNDVTPTTNAVNMVFKHMLTNLIINVTNESGADISSVVLQGAIPTAEVDLESLSVTVDDTASATSDITAQEVTANARYRAIVIPQTVEFTLAVKTSNNKTLTQELASAALVQGGQYTINVRVMSDGIAVTMSGEIENWTDQGEIGSKVPFEEHEGYFIYDGVTYRTVNLPNGTTWMAEPLRYLPEGYTPSADPTADSHIWYPYALEDDNNHDGVNADRAVALTDEQSIAEKGYFYDTYAAFGGVDITVDNCYDFEETRGICPPGWHIPSRTEYIALCGLSNKNAFGETGNYVDNTALFFDEGYGGGKWTLFEDAGWNFVPSGTRQQNGFTATPAYQLTQLWSGNTSLSEMYGTPALTYIMSSTCYQPNYSTTQVDENGDPLHINTQFFAMMTTFSSSYKEGRINVSYASIKAGLQVRCVKNS